MKNRDRTARPRGPLRPPLRLHQRSSAIPPVQARKGDFISDYADYADVLEAPREVHEAVAISLLAAVLNPRLTIVHGRPLTLDLWTLILSGSGFGRNTLVDLAFPILDASAQSTLVRGATWGSGPALYQDLAENPTGLYVWPEMSQVLKTIQQPGFMGAKQWLTDRYDNTRLPDAVQYRRTGAPNNTPSIVFTSAPRVNILATSSIEWLVANLEREDTTGGFLPRWLILQMTQPSRVIPKPRTPDQQLIQPLADHLSRAATLAGVADLSGVEELYAAWYRQAHTRFMLQPNRALATPFFNRQRAQVLKLAVIFEVSASCSLKVSPEAMHRATQWAESIEQTIFALLPTGMTAEGFAVDRMEQRIRQVGVPGMTQSELTRAFQDGSKHRDRLDRLKTLFQGGRVCPYQRHTAGRTAAIFVHCEFAAQHEKEFPNDLPK
jgi:hypothetical protein